MIKINYDSFFEKATGHPPYDYQKRMAGGERTDRPEAEWLAGRTTCHSQIIDIPTGLGKTAAVVVAWLWNRIHLQNPEWPRRLLYCLPMPTQHFHGPQSNIHPYYEHHIHPTHS